MNRVSKMISSGIFLLGIICILVCMGCSGPKGAKEEEIEKTGVNWETLQEVEQLSLSYATNFSVTTYEQGYQTIEMSTGDLFVIVPEEKRVPTHLPENCQVLQQPLDHIYQVASSGMDLIDTLDGLDQVAFVGTKKEDFCNPLVQEAMDKGTILYAGKYNAPDYEMMLQKGCDLAVENTMIYHNPKAKEQLQRLGIPVVVELSSYEDHPLGRLEWIKFYGTLLGKEKEAEAFFKEQETLFLEIEATKVASKKIAFFYVTSNGAINVRCGDDYIAKLIELAGGEYVFSDLVQQDSNRSSMSIQMEEFLYRAKDADILIYNSTVGTPLQSIEDLKEKHPMFAQLKGVKNQQVYDTGKNFYQQTSDMVLFAKELQQVLQNQQIHEGEFLKHIN